MERFFSDRVETALKYIYYDLAAGRGQEGFQLLHQAAQEGDADACCLLARCLYGPEYTCPGHGFTVDGRAGDELMRRSVLGGSAIGALGALLPDAHRQCVLLGRFCSNSGEGPGGF